MNDHKHLFAFIALLLFRAGANAQPITLEEYYAVLERNHPLLRREILSARIATNRNEQSLTSRDWRSEVRAAYDHAEPLSTSPFIPDSIDRYAVTAAAAKPFWSTGGNVAFTLSSSLTEQSLPVINIPSGTGSFSILTGLERYYENRASVSYVQPLLRNLGGRLYRLPYEAGGFDAQAARLQSIENIENFLLDMGTRFIDWALLQEKLRIAEERLRLTREELKLVKERRRSNLVDRADVLRAEDAVRAASQNQLLMESQFKAKSAELAVLARSNDIETMSPDFDLYRQVAFPPDDAAAAVIGHSRLLKSLAQRREALARQVALLGESSRPDLSLSVSYGVLSGSATLQNAADFRRNEYSAALLLTQPFGSSTARSETRTAELELRKIADATEQVTLELTAALTGLLIQLKHMQQILALSQAQISSAEERTRAEIELYNQSRGQLTFVLQSMESEQNSRTAYAETAAACQKLFLQYLAFEDRLLGTLGSGAELP